MQGKRKVLAESMDLVTHVMSQSKALSLPQVNDDSVGGGAGRDGIRKRRKLTTKGDLCHPG